MIDCRSTSIISGSISPGVLRGRDELVRHQQPVLRVLPAHQRLDADDLAGPAVALGLVVDDELVRVDPAAEVAEQRQPLGCVPVVLRLVDRVAAAALLRGVQRDVGPLQQRLSVAAVLR
ncbi:MAG TPA: hypothetical protein VEZ46_17585 [Mycobacteriales bacterium]|nr:hypothetical protein [Mycobacteriales bacterium]